MSIRIPKNSSRLLVIRVVLAISLFLASSPNWAQTFKHPILEEIASSYEAALVESYGDLTTSSSLLLKQSALAAQSGKWLAARLNLEKLTGRSLSSASTWLRLAQSWQASEPAEERSAAAAYMALKLAQSDEKPDCASFNAM